MVQNIMRFVRMALANGQHRKRYLLSIYINNTNFVPYIALWLKMDNFSKILKMLDPEIFPVGRIQIQSA